MKLTAEQFEQIVASLRSDAGPGGGPQKRRAPRVGLRAVVTVVPVGGRLPTGGLPPAARQARVRELSADGIGLVHPGPLSPGSSFVAVLPRGTGEVLGAVYRVTRCDRRGDRDFGVGARLVRMVDAAALRPVGE